MNCSTAKKLKPKEIVIHKETGNTLQVVNIRIQKPMNLINRNEIFILCDDGKEYHYSKLI